MSDDQAVEGAGTGGETGGDHVVDDVGDADGVAVSGAGHELIHEDQAEASLRGIIVGLGLPLLPSGSPLIRRRDGCAEYENGVVAELGRWEVENTVVESESVAAWEEKAAHLESAAQFSDQEMDKVSLRRS